MLTSKQQAAIYFEAQVRQLPRLFSTCPACPIGQQMFWWSLVASGLTCEARPHTACALPSPRQAAWYVTLICCQFWHIWVCKTREASIFKHGIFRNPVTLWGVCISVAVMLVVVYAPFLQVTCYAP